MREKISFGDFEKRYLAQPDGYLSVWFSFERSQQEESYEGTSTCLFLEMDMVSPHRLEDGKIRFLSVQIDTKEQAEKAVRYLRETQRLLNESLERNFADSQESLSTLP